MSSDIERDIPRKSLEPPFSKRSIESRLLRESSTFEESALGNRRIGQGSDDDLQKATFPGTMVEHLAPGGTKETVAVGPADVLHYTLVKETPCGQKGASNPEYEPLPYCQAATQASNQEPVRDCTDPNDPKTTTSSSASSTTTKDQELTGEGALTLLSAVESTSSSTLQAKEEDLNVDTPAGSVVMSEFSKGGPVSQVGGAVISSVEGHQAIRKANTEPDNELTHPEDASTASSPSGQVPHDEQELCLVEPGKHPSSLLPLSESATQELGRDGSEGQPKSIPVVESPDRRSVRFEQQPGTMVSMPSRKRRRKDALFPTVSHGSRSVSGSAMTSSTTTRDSPLGILRNVPFVPQFLGNRRGQALWKSWPALIILSAILLSSVLAAHMLLAKTRPQVALCRTKPCLEYARLLAASVNTSLDPCIDFTRFVCSGWRRNNKLSVQETWMMFDLRHLYQTLRSVEVPRKQQTMLQRSAALMRSCEAVRNGEMDELPKVRTALLAAGIVWPLVPDTVDVLRTWLYTSLRLQWNSVLRVSIRRTPNTTVVSLEPPREFLYIVAKHQQLTKDVEGAKRYFETLRREFYAVAEPPPNETETTVNFDTTYQMDIMYLGLLQTVMAFPSEYSKLDAAWLFGTVATLTRDRLLREVELMGESVSGDVVFVSAKQPFARLFLQMWKYRGEREMHLFLSWCTVQTIALYTNRRLLMNFYNRETTVDLYHAVLCLSKVYLLCGSEVFGKYFEEVLSHQGMHVAQRVVEGTLGEFASRLQRWQYRDDNISLLEDWKSTDPVLRYFDPRIMSEEQRQRAPDATCTRDMGDSLVNNLRLASLGHVMEVHRWASELMEHADWYVLQPGKDPALLPYALAFPWYNEGGTRFMNQAGLGNLVAFAMSVLLITSYVRHGAADSAIRRVIKSAEKASRPRDPVGSDRIVQMIRTLAFDVSFEAYRAAGATALDEHLEGFERYGGTAMFFIASCYALCRGSDGFVPFTGVECDEPLRNIEGFGEAFECELGSTMNPVNKTILM